MIKNGQSLFANRKHTKETKIKISNSNKGKSRNKGKIPWNKGIMGVFRHSDETKLKISKTSKGRKYGKEARKNMSIAQRKRFNTIEKINKTVKDLRKTYEYRQWRKAVFKRDNYTCQKCNIRNKKGLGKTIILEAHHIKPFALYIELRFNINNGLTLCKKCHKLTDTYAKRIDRKIRDAKV